MGNKVYRILIYAFIIGIVSVLSFNLYINKKMEQHGESPELYFPKYEALPTTLKINQSYNVSVVLSNSRIQQEMYVFEIESEITSFTQNITLNRDENMIFTVEIIPTEKGWDLITVQEKRYNNTLTHFNAGVLVLSSQYSDFSSSLSQKKYMPLSHQVSKFGAIFHTNLTSHELKNKPFTKSSEVRSTEFNRYYVFQRNITLFIEHDELYLNSFSIEYVYQQLKEPFIVKFYKESAESGEEFEVYFWYELI